MFKKLFQLDLRSLALARVCLGILAFFDIGRRLDDIPAFFSDSGLLSRAQLFQDFELPWRMSLLNLNGSPTFAFIIAIFGMLASIFFTLGWRTRTANFVIWLVTISFQSRFPEGATSGGDMLIRIFFFWSLFLPMSGQYSIDRALSNTKIKTNKYFSVFTAIWIIQIFLLYFFTFLYKWAPVYHTTFEAVWYMLQLDIFTTNVGKWMGQQYELTRLLSFSAYALEIIGPLMLLIPFKRDFFRGIAVVSFWAFHLGIALTLHLGNFVPICLIIWVGLIPSSWWIYLSSKLNTTKEQTTVLYYNSGSRLARKFSLVMKEMLILDKLQIFPGSHLKEGHLLTIEESPKNVFGKMLLTSRFKIIRKMGQFFLSELGIYLNEVSESGHVSLNNEKRISYAPLKSYKTFEYIVDFVSFENIRFKLNRLEKAFGAFILALIIGWNIEGYVEDRDWYIGEPFDQIMFTLNLNQGWAMFAPHPQRSDGWWVMDGTLKNGKKWDVLNDKKVSFDRPADIYETYQSEDWRKFLDNLSGSRDEKYLLALGRYLCRKWNNEKSGDQNLMTFKLYFMQEWTNPPHMAQSPVKKLQLWNHSCF